MKERTPGPAGFVWGPSLGNFHTSRDSAGLDFHKQEYPTVNYKLVLTKSIANDWTTKAFAICLYRDWASLIVQLVKKLPVMQETMVQFLEQEDLLEKG